MATETHPFPPFLPENARILMAGTFPPQPHRWAMDFYYPNRQNDMWRIWGYIYAGDKDYFVDKANKGFYLGKIKDFCCEIGLALTDTGCEVLREKGNASDKFLRIIRPFDLDAMLAQMPHCHSIIVTGELAGETLRSIVGCEPLKIGEPQIIERNGRELALWRCPSSSRAYPMPVEQKAASYRQVLEYEDARSANSRK